MSNIKHRLSQLEKQQPAQYLNLRKTDAELTTRVSQVLAQPHLVTSTAHNRIVELLELARTRQAQHEQPNQPN